MMKLSDIIERLQAARAKHGDIEFCVEARGPAADDGEVLGNDFVGLTFHEDSYGDYVCLVTETKGP